VHLFLDNGANVNAPSGKYGSALATAIYGNEPEIVACPFRRVLT
jgi:hypothetical protein